MWCLELGNYLTGPLTLRNIQQFHIPETFQFLRMCLLRNKLKCGYNITGHLHIFTEVIEDLNKNYEGKWIGRNRPMTWPTQSCNLNPPSLCVGLHEGNDCFTSCKPQKGPQLVKSINEATIGIRQKQDCTQQQHEMTQ